MGKRGDGSRNPRRNNGNRIEKMIEKQQRPARIVSSLDPHNSRSVSIVSGDERCHGYIFMCNGRTKTDCFKYRVFGLPAARMDVLDNIHPEMKLFLFDFDLRLLYGIYVPASKGEMSIEPAAFGGRFSAQVRFQIYKDCLPLPESVFKPIIRDNYQGSKFRQELSEEHVQNLISLFRPVDMSPSQAVVSPEQNNEPPGFGVYSGTGVSCNQDLARSHVEEPPRRSQHIRHQEEPLVHVSHASVPKSRDMSLQQYYSSGAHQAYVPSLPEEELYNRYAEVPRDDQARLINRNSVAQAHHNLPPQLSTSGHGHVSTKPLSAAYWIAVANESLQKEVYPPSRQDTPSASTVMTAPSQTPPIQERESPIIFQHPPTENNDTSSSSAAPSALVVQPYTGDGPMHLPTSSSSVPGYWTPVASQDPNQVYSDHSQWQQVASAGHNTENVPTSVVQPGTDQYVSSTGTTNDSYNYGMLSGMNGVPVQHHNSTAYYSGTNGVPVQHHDSTAYYSGTNGVPVQHQDSKAYYSGTNGVPVQHQDSTAYYSGTNGVPVQHHDSTAYYSGTSVIPAQAYDTAAAATAYYPSQAGDLAAYYSGTTSVHPQQANDPTAVYYYANNTGIPAQPHEVPSAAYYSANNTGIPGQPHDPGAYYFPENSYGYSHVPLPSSQVPVYWDPNQVGVSSHIPQQMIPSGNNIASVGGENSTGAAPTIAPVDGL